MTPIMSLAIFIMLWLLVRFLPFLRVFIIGSLRLQVKRTNETLGKLHFFTSFICMNGVFMPMFITGLAGVSRRLWDGGESYAHAAGVFQLNEFMSIFVAIRCLATFLHC